MYLKIITLLLIICHSSISGLFKDNYKWIPVDQIGDIYLRYDPNSLRIPGNKLSIGLTTVLKNGNIAETKGYLNGNTKWRNFKIKVEGGYFLWGKITFTNFEDYLKDNGITISVYSRRTGKLLKTQFIPYNFETSVQLITKGEYKKALGNKIDVGIKKTYNNLMVQELWPTKGTDFFDEFKITFSGGQFRYGNFYICDDPFLVRNHQVKIKISYNKCNSLADSLSIMLDYRDKYVFRSHGHSGFSGNNGDDGDDGNKGCDGKNGRNGSDGSDGSQGEDLDVYTDVYLDTLIQQELMFVEIRNLTTEQKNRFLFNTDGGSMDIYNIGGRGGNGGNGGDGGDGGKGPDGATVTKTVEINDSTEIEVTFQLPGENGGNGGNGGYSGNGGNGGDGGNINIYYTPYAEPYLNLIVPESIGGSGGNPGNAGSSGSGGAGGKGDPNGKAGRSGASGDSGSYGYNGSSGKVWFIPVTY